MKKEEKSMKKYIKKFAILTEVNSKNTRDIIVLKIEGDWNDGDYISKTYYIGKDNLITVLKDIEENNLSEWAPGGAPDGAEFHDLWVEEFYYIDKKGRKFDITSKV